MAPEFGKIQGGVLGLLQHFTEEETAQMVATEPCLLLEDIDKVLRELGR